MSHFLYQQRAEPLPDLAPAPSVPAMDSWFRQQPNPLPKPRLTWAQFYVVPVLVSRDDDLEEEWPGRIGNAVIPTRRVWRPEGCYVKPVLVPLPKIDWLVQRQEPVRIGPRLVATGYTAPPVLVPLPKLDWLVQRQERPRTTPWLPSSGGVWPVDVPVVGPTVPPMDSWFEQPPRPCYLVQRTAHGYTVQPVLVPLPKLDWLNQQRDPARTRPWLVPSGAVWPVQVPVVATTINVADWMQPPQLPRWLVWRPTGGPVAFWGPPGIVRAPELCHVFMRFPDILVALGAVGPITPPQAKLKRIRPNEKNPTEHRRTLQQIDRIIRDLTKD